MSQLELPFSDQSEFEFAKDHPPKPPALPPVLRRSVSRRPEGGPAPANIFFCLFPDPATAEQIGCRTLDLRSILGLTGTPLTTDRLHLTTHFLGQFDEVPGEIVEIAREVAGEIAARATSFPVKLRRAGSFTGGREKFPFVLRDQGEDNSALKDFHGRLGAGLRARGIKGVSARLTPHVTLLYDRQQVQERPVETVRWSATEFHLVHSHVGRSRYTVLDRWSLGNPG